MQFFVSANPSTTCCDSISRSVSDGTGSSQTAAAAAAASFCCPSYENRLLASSRTELNAALGMYSSPYAAAAAASQNYANYFPYSTDPSAIYSTLVGSFDAQKGEGGSQADRSARFINLSHTANISVSISLLIQRQLLSHFPFKAAKERGKRDRWTSKRVKNDWFEQNLLLNPLFVFCFKILPLVSVILGVGGHQILQLVEKIVYFKRKSRSSSCCSAAETFLSISVYI